MTERSAVLRILCLLIVALAGGAPYQAAAQGAQLGLSFGPRAPYASDQILVKFATTAREAATRRYREQRGFRALREFRSIGAQLEGLPAGMTVDAALALLRSDPEVVYAEPNYYRYADQIVPDDPFFGLLWGLHNTGQTVNGTTGTAGADIDAPEAWDVTTGSLAVVVAVVDSGLDFTHPDLAPNHWVNEDEIAGNGIDDDGNGYVDDVHGWDFVADDGSPYPNDANGHGTHVAGTIGAVGNNGIGVAGVSWGARIMPLRFLDAYGTGPTSDAILAIEYASANGARIINNSWGGGGFSQALQDAIEASPALVVCAAGNSGVDADLVPHYPAAYSSANILSVAATDADDQLASFSNYGATSVDLAAPGVDIYSSVPGRRALWQDDFDDGNTSGWNSGGPNNDWGVTPAEFVSTPYSLADSPIGDYSQRTNSWIRTPALDLSTASNAAFEFQIKGRSEAGYDLLTVEVSTDGSVWFWKPIRLAGIGTLPAVSGTISAWTTAQVDLSAYDGVGTLYVRFAFLTDWTNNYDGWYIDDVAVTAAAVSYDGSEYAFKSGTSMAAPHASGVAALVAALNPEWTALQIKASIKDTVDPVPGLDGLVATGGRLNAARAIAVRTPLSAATASGVTHLWRTIRLPFHYNAPVVIAGPPTYTGVQPGVVRLLNVTPGSFDLRFQEWDYLDQRHWEEQVPYLVAEQGRQIMPDGSVWEAGVFTLSGTGTWLAQPFSSPFPTPPALFLTVQTRNGWQAVTVRARNVGNTGFEAALFEQESLMDGHWPETVGYLAVHAASASGSMSVDGQQVPYSLHTAQVDHRFTPVGTVAIKLEEEQSKDDEVAHWPETVQLLKLGDQLYTQVVSVNGLDTAAIRQKPTP